jgi:hypothetical protein
VQPQQESTVFRKASIDQSSVAWPASKFASRSTLSGEQKRRFRLDGYLRVAEKISPTAEINDIRETLSRLIAGRVGFSQGKLFDMTGSGSEERLLFPSLHDPSLYAPSLKKTMAWQAALQMARELLGPDAIVSGEHVLFKPAKVGPATPWHQDEAFRDPNFEYNELSIWIALQPTTPENGCMHFVPGSNRGDVLPHHSPGDDPAIHALECLHAPKLDAMVACPLPTGGFTIHGGRTLHFTPENTSDVDRLGYILIFNTPPKFKPSMRKFTWNLDKQTARAKRERSWMKKGGLVVHAWRLGSRYLTSGPSWWAWFGRRVIAKVTGNLAPAGTRDHSA